MLFRSILLKIPARLGPLARVHYAAIPPERTAYQHSWPPYYPSFIENPKTENRVRPDRYREPMASNQQERSTLNLPPRVVDLAKDPGARGTFSKGPLRRNPAGTHRLPALLATLLPEFYRKPENRKPGTTPVGQLSEAFAH